MADESSLLSTLNNNSHAKRQIKQRTYPLDHHIQHAIYQQFLLQDCRYFLLVVMHDVMTGE